MVLRFVSIIVFALVLCGIDAALIAQDERDPNEILRLIPALQFLAVDAEPEPVPDPVPMPETELPVAAIEILDRYQAEAKEIRQRAEQEIAVRREATIKTLQTLQDQYTREAKLDEAVAIRDKIRMLRFAHLKPRPNPGNLTSFRTRIGTTFYFEVVGARQGAVWGTDVYTYDSSLAAAAVHAGVLKLGQRGIVKVTMVMSPESHQGSARNGILSADFGPFGASYTVTRPQPTDVDTSGTEVQGDAPEPQELILRGRIIRENPGF
jgi:hypothetical protein